jgi:hypothetical protein
MAEKKKFFVFQDVIAGTLIAKLYGNMLFFLDKKSQGWLNLP